MNSRFLTICFLALMAAAFAACTKNYAVPAAPKSPPKLNVVNATADTLDFFVNGTRQNNQSDIYPDGATYWLSVVYGKATYSFKNTGRPATLFSLAETLDTGTFQTMFLVGTSADKVFLVNDSVTNATAITAGDTTSAIRFVNAAPNMGGLDIVVTKGKTTPISIKNCSYKYLSSYMSLKDTVTKIDVYATGTTKAIFDTTFTPVPGQSYTFFTKGSTAVAAGYAAFGAAMFTSQTAVLHN
jgi:hypothetical protein